jgi:hypothetical protein
VAIQAGTGATVLVTGHPDALRLLKAKFTS